MILVSHVEKSEALANKIDLRRDCEPLAGLQWLWGPFIAPGPPLWQGVQEGLQVTANLRPLARIHNYVRNHSAPANQLPSNVFEFAEHRWPVPLDLLAQPADKEQLVDAVNLLIGPCRGAEGRCQPSLHIDAAIGGDC